MSEAADPFAYPVPAPWQWRALLPGDLPAPCTCSGAQDEPECQACVGAAAEERATWVRLAMVDPDDDEDDALADEVRAELMMQEG